MKFLTEKESDDWEPPFNNLQSLLLCFQILLNYHNTEGDIII